VDPYRYFEDITQPEVAVWMKAQSDHAHAVLQALPQRAAFRGRLEALESSGSDAVTRVQRRSDGSLFYLLRGTGDNQYKLMVQSADGTPARVLLDPMALALPGAKPGQPQAINMFSASPRSTHVGVLVSAAGSEEVVLFVIEVATGKVIVGPIDRAGIPSWIDEGQFTMARLQAPGPGRTALDKYRDGALELVTLPRELLTLKQEVLPARQWQGLSTDRDSDILARRIPGSQRALVLVGQGVANELALYTGDWADVHSAQARWTPVVSPADGVVDFSPRGNTLYVVTHKDAPRMKVLAYDLTQPKRPPREVLPPSERVIQRVVAARDALYVLAREGNINVLLRQSYTVGAPFQPVKLPLQGQIYPDFGWGRDAWSVEQDGLLIGLQSWTQGLRYVAVEPSGAVRDLALPVLSADDAPLGLSTTEVLVPSHDGAKVPMSIVHRQDVKLDGKNPVWLSAYASYGVTMEPSFQRARLAWLELGGVLVFANPRGSGVFGQDWYMAGKGIRKANTWLDVIACGEYLVAKGWTNPRQLGLTGRSAGGLLAGRVLTERPDLFGAVVPAVGVLDGLRFEFEPNGPPNIPEFGSVTTEEGFKGLLAMSAYAHVKDGTRYPPVLLPHGVNDPRVAVWESAKFAARLLAARQGDSPVLLRLDYGSGHGIGNTRIQQLEEEADTYAFLWHHLRRRD
jgi:prolyl oligopeptidase